MTNNLNFLFLALFLTGCSAAIDLPTPTPTATPTATAHIADATPRPSATEQATNSPAPLDTCTVSTGVPAGYLNMRQGAGIEYSIVRVLNEGEVLTVTTRGEWHEVTDAQGVHGFVNSNYCR